MAAEEEKNEEEVKGGGLDPEKIKKLMFFGLIGLNVLFTAGGAYLAYMATLGFQSSPVSEDYFLPELEANRENRQEQPITFTLEPFTVNLEGRPRKIVRAVISLGMLDEMGFEEVVALEPEARDAIVRIFQEKSFEEIESIQGKLFLKDQIAQSVNSFLKEGVVKDVYFSELVAQ